MRLFPCMNLERIRDKILEAMKDFEQAMCVRFVEATDEEELMVFTSDGYCSAGVGRGGSSRVSI